MYSRIRKNFMFQNSSNGMERNLIKLSQLRFKNFKTALVLSVS